MESQDLFEDVERPLRPINNFEPPGSVPSKKSRMSSTTTKQATSRNIVEIREEEEDDGSESDESEDHNVNAFLKRHKMRAKMYKLDEAVQKAFLQVGYGNMDHANIERIVGHYRKSDITKKDYEKIIGGHELATDGIVGDELSKLLATTAGMINKDASKFNAEEFSENLKREGIFLFYDKNCRDIFFNPPQFPSLCFLDTDAMPKIKKPRVGRGRINSKKGELVDVKGKQGDENDEEDTSLMQQLSYVKKCFKNALKRAGKDYINYYSFVINPKDFGATIQNCFYVSFLLKDSDMFLEKKDDDEYPILRKLTEGEIENKANAEATGKPLTAYQCVNTMTYQKWKHLINRLNITEALIPAK